MGVREVSGTGFVRDYNEFFSGMNSFYFSSQLGIIIVWQILAFVLKNVNKTWPLLLGPINKASPSLSSCWLQGLLSAQQGADKPT